MHGLYSVSEYYLRKYNAAQNGILIRYGAPEPWKGTAGKIDGILIRYGAPEPWKGTAGKIGHTKPSRAIDPQEVKRKKNDGRPPDTIKELTKTVKNQKIPVIWAPNLGPPSYKWNNNSCWLDSSLELLYQLNENIDDSLVTHTLVNQRDALRHSLHDSGAIQELDSYEPLLSWLITSISKVDQEISYPAKKYLYPLYVDIHSCSGSPETSGHHLELVKPRYRSELLLKTVDHQTFNGNFKDFFGNYIRIDKPPVTAHTCWRVKNGNESLCSGIREDVKDLVLSIPVLLLVEVGGDETRPSAPQYPSWDFPASVYPHTRPSSRNPHSIVYDLVGHALYNPSISHFNSRYASGDKKSIYTYDGMKYGGHPKEEPKAKFSGYIAGRDIQCPDGYSVTLALYCLRGGLPAQEEFYRIRTQALLRRFNLKFDRPTPDTIPSISISSSLNLILLPSHRRQEWKAMKTTLEYVTNPESKRRTSDKPITSSDGEPEGPFFIPPKDKSISPPKSPAPSLPDSLFAINCRCGASGDGNILYRSDLEGEAIQCFGCSEWSHIACQRNGSACKLGKDDVFLCHECNVYDARAMYGLNKKKPTRTSLRREMEERTLSKKPLKERLRRGRGVLVKHESFWYPARLISLQDSNGYLTVHCWRGCEIITPGLTPDSVSLVPFSDVIDSLWGDRHGQRQIQLGKWTPTWQIPTDEDLLSNPSLIPYSNKVNRALTPARETLHQLLYDPSKLDSTLIPAKAWLESSNKNISKTIIPYTGPLTMTDENSSDNAKKDILINKAWAAQCRPRTTQEILKKDVDLECLSLLEEEMFENSIRAGVAGNEQWGLDVGNHQDDWIPYGDLPDEWNGGDRDGLEDETELMCGSNYVDFPKRPTPKEPTQPRPRPRPIQK
ncbi:hypothetical protein CVT25_012365 [Psilocybe cyanescens]|uniref:Zinc finger PHD-type domain-containing protein n=1 Tax=Psilocybe cyanescens TaxID=93625 RepID=A0A409XC01_PSICY|nr:hypothetical protein CVT25_012365 [Psilocybe cyanescens]